MNSNGLVFYLTLFASATILVQAISVLDRHTWKTHQGMRLAYIGVACAAFWVLARCLYVGEIGIEPLVAVLLAQSVFLAVDRRGRHDGTHKDDRRDAL